MVTVNPPGISTQVAPSRAVNLHAVWSLRSDLQVVWITGRSPDEGYWVVRDPLARDWFCLTSVEKSLLEIVDGSRTLAELCRLATRSLQPLEISVDGLVDFYLRARRSGLLVTVGRSGSIDEATGYPPNRSTGSTIVWISKLLFLRLPGFNPNSFARFPSLFHQIARSRLAPIAAVLVLIIALLIVVGQFDTLSTELSMLVSRTDLWFWWLVLVTVAAAKTIHEAAHVIACRWVGAECREFGLMLLIGTPCLYCDVSDLWAVSSRRNRILVSAAGMIAEWLLAAVATIIWSLTHPSTVHQLSLIVMTVCSLSTVMVNANPLLRYDGYFILSDWIGVPNLGQRANDALVDWIGRLIDGRSDRKTIDVAVGRPLAPAILVMYALASIIYRVFVVGLILLLIYRGATDIGIGILGVSLAALLAVSMLSRSSSYLVSRLKPAGANPFRWSRRVAICFSLLTGMVLMLGVPLPRRVTIPVLVVAEDQHAIHSMESGTVVDSRAPEPMVQPGDVLLRLSNHELEDRLHVVAAELAAANRIMDVLQSRRGRGADSAAALAVAVKRQQTAEKNHSQMNLRFERLAIRSPAAGRFSPYLSPSNQGYSDIWRPGQWLQAGTPIGWIGHPTLRAATAWVSEDQIDLIRAGQTVEFRHSTIRADRVSGVIRHVSTAAQRTIPAELQTVLISTESPAKRSLYQIHLSISESTAGDVLPLRSVVWARVHVEPASLWNRLQRKFAAEYRGL